MLFRSVLLATLVGIAQGLYAAMPKAWKSLEASTNPAPLPAERIADEPREDDLR